jgi:hypothetical protein
VDVLCRPCALSALVDRCCLARVVGGTDTEKAVPLDDPQIEFGAFSRCLCVLAFAQRGQMRALGASVVASWRLSRWSLTSRLSSASRSSHETTPTLRHRYSSPHFSGSGTVSLIIIIFIFIFFYPITVSAFYVCTCFLVLVSLSHPVYRRRTLSTVQCLPL